ncbi:TonB-dependent receptor [Pseudomonas sp. gcc21]|uniref:TonB-dependent receptor n=1 Tax=Pseudomonas sp. gcc21 TaxID=2726989 RepID=UPI0014519706|nr:TonB-dependent receptor [Pseudomonas sp. gcc21]QJD58246.1 TonB-dependent receptor [Pseudomonas sp. gcc21]
MPRTCALTLSLSCLAIACVEAAEQHESALALPATTVSTTRMPGTVAQIAGSVQRIEAAEIQQQSAAGTKLADVVGFLIPSLGASSGTASNYGQTMRGRQVQVLIDGVPQTGSRDVARQLNSISPDSIEHIEVLSGATALYGAGATGGIINIVTKQSQGEPLAFRSRIGVAGGELDGDSLTYELGQSVAFARESVDGFFGINATERGARLDASGDRIAPEPAQTSREDTRTLDLNGRLNIQLGEARQLTLSAQHYDDEQDTDYGPDYGPGLAALLVPGFQPSLDAVDGLVLDDQPRTRRNRFSATYQDEDVLGQQLTAEAYYRKERSRFYPFATPFSVSNALPALMALPVTPAERAALAERIQGSAIAVLQSESEVEVTGLRLALQSGLDVGGRTTELVYGVDYEQEQNNQNADSFDLATFMTSNGLVHDFTGSQYAYGPDVEIDKLGAFLQTRTPLTEALSLQAGVRHERIRSESDAFTPTAEALLADLGSDFGLGYAPGAVASGSVRHNATLFNVGLVYDLDDQQQLFVNFSQGFSLPDMQRVLRDVTPGFTVSSDNVEPIKVNSVETGWRHDGARMDASVTAFYNRSDKVVQFQRDFSVSVADTDERVYGAETRLAYQVAPQWSLGGSLAYTRGQFKDSSGTWRDMNSFRVSPLKATIYGAWDRNGYGARLQMLAIRGTDDAYEDSLRASFDANVRPTPAAQIDGYAVTDLLTYAELAEGTLELGIYNLFDRDYRSVYSQEAEATYGSLSAIPAEGRTVALSYSLEY